MNKQEMSNKTTLRKIRQLLSAGKSCDDCKNYEPKEKLPEVKVEAWAWSNGEIFPSTIPPMLKDVPAFSFCNNIISWSYTFRDQPDWERLVRETLGQGAEVVRVTPVKGIIRPLYCGGRDPYVISKYPLRYLDSFSGEPIFSKYYCGWMEAPHVLSDYDIEAAIREHHKADEPKSAHKRGERFKGKIASYSMSSVPAGCHLEYVGRMNHGDERNVYFVNGFGRAVYRDYPGKWVYPCEILMLVPDEPRYEVGDWVDATHFSTLGIIDQIHDETLYVKSFSGTTITFSYDDVRPAVSADFERTVDGVRVRLYETNDDDEVQMEAEGDMTGYRIYVNGKEDNTTDIVFSKALAHIPCDDGSIGIPVIPLSVSKGVFDAPTN